MALVPHCFLCRSKVFCCWEVQHLQQCPLNMCKGQPRQARPPKVSLEGKRKAHPFANQRQESTTGTRSWRGGAAARECHRVSKAGGMPLVPSVGAGVASTSCLASCSSTWARHSPPGKRDCPEMLNSHIRRHHKNKKFIFYSTSIFLISCHSYLPEQAKEPHYQQIRAVMSFLSQKAHLAMQQNTQLQHFSAAFIPYHTLNEGKGYKMLFWTCPATCTDTVPGPRRCQQRTDLLFTSTDMGRTRATNILKKQNAFGKISACCSCPSAEFILPVLVSHGMAMNFHIL